MTKAIKFNLLLDKHPVRDLEDLRANFNLDDLLTAYHSQVLHRWLEVRGLTAELEQLNAIKSTDELSIASALCELFQENLSEADIKTAVYPFEFRKQQQQRLEGLASQQFNKDAVIEGYHAGYKKLCAKMLEKAGDYPFLKAAVNTLWVDYAQLFCVDFNRFFDDFIEKSPLTLFTMLANDDYRQSGLFKPKRRETVFSSIPVSNVGNESEGDIIKYRSKTTQINWNKITDKKVIIKKVNNLSNLVKIKDNKGLMYSSSTAVGKILDGLNFYSLNSTVQQNNVCDSIEFRAGLVTELLATVQQNNVCDSIEYAIITPVQSTPLLPPYKSYAGVTEGHWEYLEPKGTKCLILKMEEGNVLANADQKLEQIKANDVNKQFLILDGIMYKSNNANHALIYMVI